MSRFLCYILILPVLILAACDKAPRGVIGERKMASLVEDLLKADAYMDMHSGQFDNDSLRRVMKQSVMLRHGVNQAMYDSSLVWYAHNMDAYTEVYERVVESLESQREKVRDEVQNNKLTTPLPKKKIEARRNISASGDTIDIWERQRLWLLPPALHTGYITFDQTPDDRYRQGDRYELSFKSVAVGSGLKLLLAVDYTDGATAFMSRGNCPDGWNKLALQTDSTRAVKRIYGYVRYDHRPGGFAIVDSVAMLRMHKEDKSYGYIGVQRLLERNK